MSQSIPPSGHTQKEDFEMVAEKNPEIRKAVDTLYELSADENIRAEYERHQKAWRDRMNQIEGARLDSLTDVARKMKGAGEAVHKITMYTGLTAQEIEKL
jgi:hypothetical protein